MQRTRIIITLEEALVAATGNRHPLTATVEQDEVVLRSEIIPGIIRLNRDAVTALNLMFHLSTPGGKK